MGAINLINCISGVANTGVVPCFLDFKFPQGMIITPKGATLDVTANSGNLLTTLSTNFYNASKSARWYPWYNILDVKDNSEKKRVQTFPSGGSTVVLELFNNWMFQWFEGGLNMLQALRTFNGSNWDFMLIDNDPTGSKMMGIKGSTSNIIQAIPTDGGRIWTDPWILNNAQKITEYNTEVDFNQKYATDQAAMVQFASTFNFSTQLRGLQNANLSSPGANATPGNFNVNVKSDTSQDIAALQGAGLAVAGLWTAINHTSGLSITPSGVAYVPPIGTFGTTGYVYGYYTITLPTTAPPYPSSGNVDISLAVPATMVAANLYYETAAPVSIVKS